MSPLCVGYGFPDGAGTFYYLLREPKIVEISRCESHQILHPEYTREGRGGTKAGLLRFKRFPQIHQLRRFGADCSRFATTGVFSMFKAGGATVPSYAHPVRLTACMSFNMFLFFLFQVL
jgi:hypothetical protein